MADAWDGRPKNPDKDGWHWLGLPRTDGGMDVAPVFWSAERSAYLDDDGNEYSFVQGSAVVYVGPCPTPDGVAAALAAARRAGAEEMRERAARHVERFNGPFPDVVALSIRALPLDAPREGGEP